MTITHDAQEKAFENGQLVGDMRHWSMKWREADRVQSGKARPSFPEILFHLRYIQEQLAQMQTQSEYHTAQQHFHAAEDKLRELIERVKQ